MDIREQLLTESFASSYVDMSGADNIELLPLEPLDEENQQMPEDEVNDQSNKAAELRRRAHKLTRKKVSLKFRDPLSLTALYEYLIPSRRITTEHEDINAYVQRAGGLNEALLSVIAERDFMRYSEAHVTAYVSAFLLEGASPSVTDKCGNTPLHLAAKRAFTQCAKDLLKWGADANKQNDNLETALEVSLSTGLALKDTERMAEFSTFAAMIILEMKPAKVRDIFLANPIRKTKINFHEMVKRPCMIDAVQAVLDSLVEQVSSADTDSQYDHYKVYYSILDSNEQGETPKWTSKRNAPSLLDVIVLTNNKDVITHSSVRLLLRSKWKRFVRTSLWLRFIIFMVTMLSMTIALDLAVDINEDPRIYTTATDDILRGTMEVITLVCVLSLTITEVGNILVWRLEYFKRHTLFGFNYIHILTSLAVYSIIPLRIFDFNLQWILASVAYVSHGLNIFKYMMAIRGIAIYVYILLRLLRRDIIQFGLVFCAALFAFGGGFYFALRSEVRVFIDEATNKTILLSDLDINPDETGEFDNVFFTGLRILVEGDSVIEYFGGSNQLGPIGILVYLIYLFFVVVVLLSLLIAQMSDTFAKIQSDADRVSIMIRAKIILTQERNGMFGINFRRRYFIQEETWKNPSNYLERLNVPGIEVVSRKVRKIDKECQLNNEHLQEIRDSLADHKKHTDKRMDELMNQMKQLSHDIMRTYEATVAKTDHLTASDD